jgi:DNA-binding HxlR family transcriptional regulator
MKWDALEEERCSLARTVAVIGDRWSLLILRECYLRIRRFEEFQSSLGITRHLLAERLKKLVGYGVLRRVPYQDSPKRYEYILTRRVSTFIRSPCRSCTGATYTCRLAGTAYAASAQELWEDVRSSDDLLGMWRTSLRQGRPCSSRPWRAAIDASSRELESSQTQYTQG